MQKLHFTYLLLVCLIAGVFGSCKDPIDDPPLSIPEILDVVVSPTTVVELQDSIVFDIVYQDRDGDLGENTPNARNLFLHGTAHQLSYVGKECWYFLFYFLCTNKMASKNNNLHELLMVEIMRTSHLLMNHI